MNIVIFTEGGELIASIEPGKVTISMIDSGPGIPNVERAMQGHVLAQGELMGKYKR